MFPDQSAEDLRQAFRATLYRFQSPEGELLLQVDASSPQLRKLLQRTGENCAAVLTAYNPGGILQDERDNRRAQETLTRQLQELGLPHFAGRHEAPDGRWPDEAGILVLGLACHHARNLAARHGQLAFLWSDFAATPRLIETEATGGLWPRP